MDGKSLNIGKDKLEQLQTIFPEIFSEGKVDWEKLQLTLGEEVNINNERYVLNWAGKSDAFRAIQTPTTATLAPTREESINFDTTENIFIEGENLEVLKVLQKAYYGKIKMIYIDPPYNTGNDSFVYPDKFAESREEYLKRVNDKDEDGLLLREGLFRKNSKDNGHYHSNWLSMMYPRLFLARNLLREDGVIFVSIDDNEVHNLRLLMNELFGEENFIGALIWKRRQNVDSRSLSGLSVDHEYALVFRKSEIGRIRGQKRDLTKYNNTDNDEKGFWLSADMTGLATKEQRPNLHYELVNPETGISYPPPESGWRYSQETIAKHLKEGRIIWPKSPQGRPRYKRYLGDLTSDFTGLTSVLKTVYNTQGTRELLELFNGKQVIDFPKPLEYIKSLVQQSIFTENDDNIVLDFFAGSCTTAQAVLELNLIDKKNIRFIMVQLPEKVGIQNFENIAEIGKERIRRGLTKVKNENPLFAEQGQDLGFKVLKLKHSNFKLWRGDGIENKEELDKQLELLSDPVRPEAIEENMLFELMLKSGYPLTSRVEKCEIGKTHYYLVEGELAITLSHLDENIIKEILEIKPQQVICLDALFGDDDPLKTNTQLQFKDAGITFHCI